MLVLVAVVVVLVLYDECVSKSIDRVAMGLVILAVVTDVVV